jgi:hypothetical protein
MLSSKSDLSICPHSPRGPYTASDPWLVKSNMSINAHQKHWDSPGILLDQTGGYP